MILIFPHLAFGLRFTHRQMEGWELDNKRVSESEGESKGKGQRRRIEAFRQERGRERDLRFLNL